MRVVIECVERVGVAQEILSLLAAHQVNLEGIELQKQQEIGLVFLKTETISNEQQQKLLKEIQKIHSVSRVKEIHHLPQERKNIELMALLESLPNPVLSLDLTGKIEFLNHYAHKLLFPLYLQTLPKKKQQSQTSLLGVPLNNILVNLNRTKWYEKFLQDVASTHEQHIQPLSQSIQIAEQIWKIELLPIELWENLQKTPQNRPLGCVISLQQPQHSALDIRQFMAQQATEFDHIIGKSKKMLAVVEQAKKFALSNAPLVIQGETGTGKDLFAKACHQFSFRRDQKFIAVNCAGLPESEAETEMFGHQGHGEKSIGFFEYANGGTVLLDSIAELSLEMQAKLLRFLNDGSFRRVGEDQEIQVDVRVICTSQKPLSQLVIEGKLREDLFHRLNVLTLNLPPLRERQDDIPLLADYFIQQISLQLGIQKPSYDENFLKALHHHVWSGNLRELYNALYRACSLALHQLRVEDLALPNDVEDLLENVELADGSLDELVGRFEAALLRKFYAEYPSTRKLAQRLGLSHTAVANKLRVYGIGK